jgi:hypothetical protein
MPVDVYGDIYGDVYGAAATDNSGLGLYGDTYHDLYGDTTPATPVVPSQQYLLDGVNAPRLIVEIAWGGSTTIDPEQGYFLLGGASVSGAGKLGTGVLGTVGWVDVAADVDSVSIQRGAQSEQEQAQPSTWSVVLDNSSGRYDPTNPSGPYYGQIDVGVPIWIKAEWQGVIRGRVRGFVNDIVPTLGQDLSTVTLRCSDGLEGLGRQLLVTANTGVGEGETTGARINRILDAAGWPTSQRIIGTGLSTCQATTFGDQALGLLNKAVETELGSLYCGRNGEVVFRDRLYPYTNSRTQQVRAFLSDTGDDIDFDELQVGMLRGSIWNQASVTRDGGVEQVVTDAASAAKYGTQTYPGSAGTWLQTDQDAASIASWLVGWGKRSRLQVTSVTVKAATQSSKWWDTLLQLDILDRLRVIRNYGPWTVDAQVLIEGYSEEITKTGWDFVFSTRAADAFKPFVLGTATLGNGTIA